MKFGKIIGNVVSTVKVESFEGSRLLLIQPLDENYETVGLPIVGIDTIKAGVGDFIYYEISREASRVIENTMNPCDVAVMGIIDKKYVAEKQVISKPHAVQKVKK